MNDLKLVVLESPFAGDVEANITYARRCVRHCLQMGEAPIASHLLYTQSGILDDNIPAQRILGISAGLSWLKVVAATVVYADLGISQGMRHGIDAAEAAGIPIVLRTIDGRDLRGVL